MGRFAIACTVMAIFVGATTASGRVYDAEEAIRKMAKDGGGLGKVSLASRTAAIEALAGKMKSGDALMLPRSVSLGEVDLSAVPDGVEISHGYDGVVYINGTHDDIRFIGTRAHIIAGQKGLGKGARAGRGSLNNSLLFDAGTFEGSMDNSVLVDWGKADTRLIWGGHMPRATLNDWSNSLSIYFTANTNKGQPVTYNLVMTGNCSNSRFYHYVQTNYCANTTPANIYRNITGPLTLMQMDSEGSETTTLSYDGCSDVRTIIYRIYHSHGNAHGCTGAENSIYIDGGSNCAFVQCQDIGDPTSRSLRVTGSPSDLQIWGGGWERDASLSGDNSLAVFHTPNAFGGAPQSEWCEPTVIDDEVTFQYQGKDITQGPQGISSFPKPPLVARTGFAKSAAAAKIANPLYKSRASFGAALLAAGADPTGRRPSDEAFAKVLADNRIQEVEIPEGTFTITRPITIVQDVATEGPYSGRVVSRHLSGRHKDRTVIRALYTDRPAIKVITTERAERLLKQARQNASGPLPYQNGGYSDMTIEGGNWGIDLTDNYIQADLFRNLVIRDQTEVGIMCGTDDLETPCGFTGSCEAHEFDQNKFINITFDNTGDYGFFNNMNMLDKLLFLDCHFKGQNKAGLCAPHTGMFAGSILECTFENINGPGIDFYTKISFLGYAPHVTAIEGCTFTECGSTERAAMDFGWTELNVFANCTITTSGKAIKYGYIGTAQYMANVDVDVTTVDGGAAVALRHTRHTKNPRNTGNILRDVRANGGNIVFVNDLAEQEALADTYSGSSYWGALRLRSDWDGFNHDGVKWWQMDDPSDSRPWVYPSLLIDSEFGNGRYDYALVATDIDGAVTNTVALQGQVGAGPRGIAARPGVKKATPYVVYDLRGRVVRRVHQPRTSAHTLDLSRGVYLLRDGHTVRTHMPVR